MPQPVECGLWRHPLPAEVAGLPGAVYAGLDIGQAVVPLLIGTLMDHGAWRTVWIALAVLQGVLIVSAFT